MRDAASKTLDSIDKLNPGTGSLDAYLFGRGDLTEGELGAGVEYRHRVNTNWSMFGNGSLGYQYGTNSGLGYSVRAGIRGVF